MHKRRPKAIVSFSMSQVRSKGSEIEDTMERALRYTGISHRKQYRIIGTPDFVILSAKIAIFCDSEFWHGYKWNIRKQGIKVNQDFWFNKIQINMMRDKKVNEQLKEEGWIVLRFWEAVIKKDITGCIEKIMTAHH